LYAGPERERPRSSDNNVVMSIQSVCGKGARERDEALDRNVFGAGSGLDVRGFQQRERIETERPQTLAQHLAALAECGFRHPFQRATFADEGLFARHHIYQG